MTNKLIAICDGHGMETAGKRTPAFPGDGGVMRENEFNRRVAELLAAHLKRCGFAILMVAPNDSDTPLRDRTDAANKAKADLYISIHANACGTGEFNPVRGLESYHMAGSSASERAANIIHRNLIAGTKLTDRGVKTADFHVLRETHMPAVLVECGFMTNLDEARLLQTEAYRMECAEELARGVCEYFDVPFIQIEEKRALRLVINDTTVECGRLIDGQVFVPLRIVGEMLGAKVSWDDTSKTATLTK
ncbi:N-acetylmuramoyl-L-alanine amidase [Paenibacillus oenotherae]|uniref:N-acetylmuramoyl-L-alanine amidase n=1 Tax=Paenibacillus oenotherae TaxID=1435645 RepID=A0ABS7DCY2_9BACL|nr:N-acetylmuramoyl-L-alanine amidase [Paenibacillus oenotherae]MBW7477797.1 N-acetylmuramoyl-L-alanine amidase [Paenibacillus oenotherae]